MDVKYKARKISDVILRHRFSFVSEEAMFACLRDLGEELSKLYKTLTLDDFLDRSAQRNAVLDEAFEAISRLDSEG